MPLHDSIPNPTDVLVGDDRNKIRTLTKSGMDPVLDEGELDYLFDLYENEGRSLFSVVAEGWEIKAAGCAHRFDVTTGDSNNSAKLSQTYKHCLERAAHYRRRANPVTVPTRAR